MPGKLARPVHPERYANRCANLQVLLSRVPVSYPTAMQLRITLEAWHGGFWRMLAALAWDRIRLRLIYWRDDAAHALHRDAWAHHDCPACSVLATECEELADAILEHVRHD